MATIYPFSKFVRAGNEPAAGLPVSSADRDVLVAESLYQRLISQGETFWSVVYPLFMAREITRATVRTLVQRGLEDAGGSYRQVVRMFNMPPQDYRRFVSFLTRYELATASS